AASKTLGVKSPPSRCAETVRGSGWTAAPPPKRWLVGVAQLFKEGLQEVERQREDDRVGLVAGDFGQRLQVPQLHRLRLAGEDLGGVREPLRRLELAFGMNDLGAPRALGLGLCRD